MMASSKSDSLAFVPEMSPDGVKTLIARGQQLRPSMGPGEISNLDVRNDPIFVELKDHVSKPDKPGSVTNPQVWTEIEVCATDLLCRSADTLVASYLCHALLKRDGYPGLITGLSCLAA